MKSAFLIITLLFHADATSVEHVWTPALALDLVALGVSLGLAVVLCALRNAAEGYEDEMGFHFRRPRPAISDLRGVAILRPRNAG